MNRQWSLFASFTSEFNLILAESQRDEEGADSKLDMTG